MKAQVLAWLGRLWKRPRGRPRRATVEILGDTIELAERRVLAELLALPPAKLWARYGAEVEAWGQLEPVLSTRLLGAAQERASEGLESAELLAWLVVGLVQRQSAGRLAEGLQRDVLADAFLLLAELRLAAGDAATGRSRLRLAKTFAATGSGSKRLQGNLELVAALFQWAAGATEAVLPALEQAAGHYRAAQDRRLEGEAQLWTALAASELEQPEASRRAWDAASRMLGSEVETLSAGVLARRERVVGR